MASSGTGVIMSHEIKYFDLEHIQNEMIELMIGQLDFKVADCCTTELAHCYPDLEI